jgi:predicted PurR-regulated permease PerM
MDTGHLRGPGLAQDLTRIVLAVLAIGGLLWAVFTVLQPFLFAGIWAATLVIATWPLLLMAQRAMGGRRGPAVAVMTAMLLLIVIVPIWWAIATVIEQGSWLIGLVADLAHFTMPAPPAWLRAIPAIGETLAEQWGKLAVMGVGGLVRQLAPYARDATQWALGAAGSVGGMVVHLLLTIAVAAILYSQGEAAARWARRFGRRLAGARGEDVVILSAQAIKGVALGVVVTALAQTAVSSLGLYLAGVPQAGILTAVVLLLCIAQLGPALVLVPAVIWMFATNAGFSAVVLLAFAAVAVTMDNVIRPVLIRRGADLPLLLILVGVMGGMLSVGLVGLFLGPVALAVAYRLLQAWVDEQDADERKGPAEPA